MGRVGPLLAGQESINNKAHSCVPAAGGGEVPVYDRCSTQFLDSIIATKFAPFFFMMMMHHPTKPWPYRRRP